MDLILRRLLLLNLVLRRVLLLDLILRWVVVLNCREGRAHDAGGGVEDILCVVRLGDALRDVLKRDCEPMDGAPRCASLTTAGKFIQTG